MHSAHSRTARLRALCAAIPARRPLLPALTRSLRSVSVILTSPPQRDKRARSGSLRLHFAQTEGGGTIRNLTGGKPGTPPAPENHGPVPGFPPDPLSCLPENNGGSRRTHDRGRCKQTSASVRGPCKGAALRAARRIQRRATWMRKPASKYSGRSCTRYRLLATGANTRRVRAAPSGDAPTRGAPLKACAGMLWRTLRDARF